MPIPQAAAILLPILCVMDVVGLWAYRGRYSREDLRLILAGGVAGVLLGALTFRYFDDAWIRVILGAHVAGFVLQRFACGREQGAHAALACARLLLVDGLGLTSTIAHAGGPPLSVYLLPRRLDKAVLVGTTVVFFAVINAVKLVPYAWLGLFDAAQPHDLARRGPAGAPWASGSGVDLMRRDPGGACSTGSATESSRWWAPSCSGTARPRCEGIARAALFAALKYLSSPSPTRIEEKNPDETLPGPGRWR